MILSSELHDTITWTTLSFVLLWNTWLWTQFI